MRDELADYRGKRITVIGCFDHFGHRVERDGRKVVTALFQGIEMSDGEFLCPHCHIQFADNMRAYDLQHGERVQFLAIVMSYKRRLPVCNKTGTMYEIDYALYHPTGIKPLNREVRLPSLVSESALVKDKAGVAVAPSDQEERGEEPDGVDEQCEVISTKDKVAPTPPATIAKEEVQPSFSRPKAKRFELLNDLQRLADIYGGFAAVQVGLDFLNDVPDSQD